MESAQTSGWSSADGQRCGFADSWGLVLICCVAATHLSIQPEISTSGQRDTGWESCADTLCSSNTPVSTTREQYIRAERHRLGVVYQYVVQQQHTCQYKRSVHQGRETQVGSRVPMFCSSNTPVITTRDQYMRAETHRLDVMC